MRVTLPFALCAAALLAGCGSPTDSRPGPPAAPSAISLAAGDAQAGIVGAALGDSLAVRVVDAAGRGVAGVQVQFATEQGSASPASAVTNADGMALTRWTLGEATGAARLTAQAPVLSGVEVAFQATAARVRPSVAPGLTKTCAINSHGRAFCWGSNASGELGTNGGPSSPSPVPVATELRFWQIVGGSQHTCALAVDRRAYCWGLNVDGQVGEGTLTDRRTPAAVSGGLRFRTLAAGGLGACGIATTGETWCWGRGESGQIGDGKNTLAPTPQRVAGGLAFDAITVGGSHACGLTADGAAYCWGYNALGQIGNGTNASVSVPTPVSGGIRFATLRAGLSITCGTEAGTGRGYCWGNDDWDALGSAVPSEECVLSGTGGPFVHHCATRPVPVEGPLAWQGVVPGDVHACGSTGTEIYCWGLNNLGVLGTGNTLSTPVPARVGAFPFVDFGIYYLHTCGITAASAVYCWGKNDYGRLGDGTLEDRRVPTPIVGTWLE